MVRFLLVHGKREDIKKRTSFPTCAKQTSIRYEYLSTQLSPARLPPRHGLRGSHYLARSFLRRPSSFNYHSNNIILLRVRIPSFYTALSRISYLAPESVQYSLSHIRTLLATCGTEILPPATQRTVSHIRHSDGKSRDKNINNAILISSIALSQKK